MNLSFKILRLLSYSFSIQDVIKQSLNYRDHFSVFFISLELD
jgi:hypothetical protein